MLFSEHSAPVSLAQTESPPAGRPQPGAPYTIEASHLPTMRSKHYLPTIRAALNCPIFVLFRPIGFT